jgi:uncharacterized membrane protein
METPSRFDAPGVHSFDVHKPGAYVVWHEGRDLPPGSRISVVDPGGAPVALDLPGSQTWSDASVTRTAAARFTAPAAGRYAIEVAGEFPRRTMAVSPDFMMGLFAAVGGAILLVLAGIGGGLGLALYAFGRRAEKPSTGAAAEPAPETEKSLREITHVVYALQASSFLLGITLIAGVVVNYLKRDAVAGTWLESHFRWQIRTFWWTLAWGAIGFITAIILVGFLVWLIAAVWLVYRIAKGWLRLSERRPVP